MGDQKQLFLFGQALPGNECGLLERMRECAEKRNKSNQQVTPALQSIPADRIKQIAVGSTHIAFLLTDHTIARLSFEIVTNVVESLVPSDKRDDTEPYVATPGAGSAARSASSSTDPASVAAQAAVNAANRTAKIRRIMMTRPGVRSGGFCRTGVIIDRNRSNRPMIPASSVPEELIVQCQVVLQGKSRDVIVRELQRTNLNVNEAVNNLLSRDDDEIEDLDETGEAYLHEELLSLLDAGLRSDGGDGYEYVISRDLARRREDPKGKDAGKNNEGTGQTLQEHFVFGDTLEIWGKKVGTNFPMPPGVEQFKKIASMNAELLALADDGQLYGWTWEKSSAPSIAPHTANLQLFGKTTNEDNKIVDIETCALRAVVLTQSGQVGSFMDASCGRKLADAFLEHLTDVPEAVERMFCCTLFSAVLSKSGTLYWRGVYPFTERRKLWEKARSKKKQVTSSSNDIVVGSEVRTKSTPIYSVGSVAVNFTNGLPMIGTLYEDAWTLNETCRFRVQTPENYDALPIGNNEKEKHREKRVSFSLAVGNRKRAAPTASDQMDEGNNGGGEGVGGGAVVAQQQSSKESAWAIRDVVFIHEESVNDVSIVKIVDGAYCGVVFKSTLDRLEQDGGGGAAPFDLSKLSIRLMRKDDLVPITSAVRASAARSPDNFQAQLKSIRLPSSVKRIISLAVDGTGFRILCVKNHQRIHLIRVSCLGKLLSDHPMPFAQNALCQPTEGVVEPYLPSVNNYGDDNLLLIRDSTGAFQPLLRNAVGGFQELAYTSLGRFYLFGMGIRFLKSPADVNLPSICTEPFSVISNKNAKGQAVSKNVNRMMLIVALIAPTPHTTTPTTESLMQSVLNCDLNSVRNILQKLSSDSVDLDERRNVAHERIEGNRNIFHVAVMNAFAKTNRDQADVESAGGDTADTSSALSRVSKWAEKWGDSSEADSARMRFDRKWQEMLGSSGNSAPTTRAKAHQLQAAAAAATKDGPRSSNGGAGDADEKDLWDVAISKADDEKTMATFSPSGSPSKKTIPATPKERQANGIDIVRELCKSAALHEHFVELMQQRDVNGQTPFQCAINFRAYTAAHLLWETTTDLRDWSQDVVDIVAPTCAENSDESALFALCANDTCSYTWTGEEHTPQDIFECYSCGLVDTLCCCTECAYTCHRNHDCKVKRTSPTAYCDCWEKFGCRALITGNLVKREQLLNLFLQNGKLVSKLNARGEHLLLFLVRTVGRQMFEHESYTKRTKRPVPPNNAVNAAGQRIPEHDLDPPKFARRALEIALSNWEVVKSLLEVGTKKAPIEEMQISESAFHLGEQHGSTHLDKFVFTLLAFCDESSLDTLLNLLIRQANRKNVKEPGADVHTFISRFVRSVVRLFVLVILISPNAVRTLLATVSENIVKAFVPIEPAHSDTFGLSGSAQQQQFVLSSSVPSASAAGGTSSSIRESLQNYRAVAISGVLSLVRASLPGLSGLSGAADKRDTKKKNAISFVLKCRRVFQTLLSYSLNELIGIADTLVAPLRHGIVKPTSAMIANEDAIELIHKHLNTEQDLSSLLKEVVEGGGNLANMMMTNGGNNRIKKLVEMRHNETTRPAGTTGGANDGSTEQPTHSDDEISNEEDEDDDEMENAPNQSYHRARENSSASVDRLHRERTASGGGRRGVERQTSSQAAAAAAEPQQEEGNEEEQEMNEVAAEDEHDEEDEDASEHEMEEDEEDEPYFDVHDDDDDDDDEEDDDDDASSNPSDAEAGDSNDTVPVMQPSTTSAEGGGAEGDVRIELVQPDAATTSANNAVDALDRFSAALAAVDGTGGGRAASGTEAASAPRRPAEATPTSGINNEGFGVTSATGRNAGLQQQIDQMATIDGVFREPTLEGSSSSTNRLWRTSAITGATNAAASSTGVGGTPLETAGGAGTTAAAVNAPGPNSEAYIAEDYQYLQSNTSTQLALCYSILVKLADELLVQLMCHTKWKQQLCRVKGISSFLDIDSVLYPEFKHLLTESFEPTWNWLHIIMDRTEAQLKYSQAISQSIVGPMVSPLASAEREEQRAAAQLAAVGTGTTADTTQQQPGQPRLASRHIAAGVTTVGAVAAAAAVTGDTTTQRRFRKKGNAGGGGLGRKPDGSAANGGAENEAENSTARTEFFTYFMSLLRSYSAESGDDLPVLEYNALRNVAFVAEAYFFHLIFLGQLKQLELENGIGVVDVQNGVGGDDIDDNEALMEVDGTNKIINEGHARRLRRFYRRSNSISYPTLSTAEQHHAFTFTAAEALPLAIRSHLLSADAERNALFALPVPERSRVGHKAIATKLGVQFPTHQSLSRLPVQYSEIVHRLSCHQQRDELGQEKQRSVSVTVKHFGDENATKKDNDEQQLNTNGVNNILLDSQFGLDSLFQQYMGRWSNTITMFARTFHEELTNRFGGDYSHSVLLNKTGVCSFSVRLLQFRKQMDKLKTVQTKDLIFSQMPREKYAMVQHTFRQLNQTYVKRLGSSSGGGTSLSNTPSQSQSGGAAVPAAAADQQQMMMLGMDQQRQAATTSPLLASHKVKVTFRDEPGEGTGVARHFYAALADAFTSMKHLPQLDNVNEDGTNRPLATAADSSTSSGSNAATTQGTPHLSRSTPIKSSSDVAKSVAQKARAIAAKVGGTSRGETAAGGGTGAAAATVPSLQQQISTDTQPLFYRTSKTGFFTPITGSNSAQRLNAFRNVGRLIGFCLQNTEIIPLPLCRHVLKYVLNRPLNWFDLAFFDPSLFDSLRSIVYNEENDEYHPSEFYEQLEMTFSVDLPAEEGGGHIELKPDGANIAVTRDNVLEYICLFVEHRLLGTHRPSLEAMRRGVFDVLPADALANLTSEDLRLILCGTQEFSIQHLQNFTKFLDESSASAEVLTKYKKTFWSVVNKLSSAEKQDLCFFWTGSPSLPSSEEGFRPLPTIMIRPADDQHLPTANTCISRLYLPIYSSKKLLREKLSLAIKARNFGFV